MSWKDLQEWQKIEIRATIEWLKREYNKSYIPGKKLMEINKRWAQLKEEYGSDVDEYLEREKIKEEHFPMAQRKELVHDAFMSSAGVEALPPPLEKYRPNTPLKFIFNVCWNCGQKYVGIKCPFCGTFKPKSITK